MNDWKKILADVDDEYLIGLANKGIVKRAYKDKEEGSAEVLSIGEEVAVKVGEETVTLRVPLGESKCSCPSRSICRHVVMGILVLKEQTVGDGAAFAAKKEDLEQGEREPQKPAQIEEGEEKKGNSGMQQQLMNEITAYPLPSIKKVMGTRHLQSLVNQVRSGFRPQIQYSSVITVQLPEQDMTVKLLSPLEYSSCTCHRKEFCVHKAAAVLWCQLDAKLVTEEMLESVLVQDTGYDIEQIKEAASQMKAFLEELLDTGLSRTSPDVLDYLERLAIISHNAGLARYEGYFRTLFDSYGKYLKRVASFQTQELMEQITRLYKRVSLLLKIEDNSTIAKYAGEFKAEYVPVGSLDLIGIAMEHFESQTGYAGETIYFLEVRTRKWYTYTVARPIFYDVKGKRRNPEKAQAPWGLSVSLEELPGLRLHITGAKCDGRGRLSSSQETKGEVVGDRKSQKLTREEIAGWYYQDFGKLFLEQIGKGREVWLKEQEEASQERMNLVFVQPKFCKKAVFSDTQQELTMVLFDEAEKEVVIEVKYSKEESWGIRYLERITEDKPPCFLGKVYLRDGRIRMYPVAILEEGAIVDDRNGG